MAANRCSICGISWPMRSEYDPCPQCLDSTDRVGNATPISEAEAASLKNHAEFERYYKEREERRLQAARSGTLTEKDRDFLRETGIRP